MEELLFLAEGIKKLEAMPMLLLFAAVFALGHMLKNYTGLNNKLIPWILVIVSIPLSLLINGFTLANGVIGFLAAYFVMAFYEHIKNTIQFIVTKKKV